MTPGLPLEDDRAQDIEEGPKVAFFLIREICAKGDDCGKDEKHLRDKKSQLPDTNHFPGIIEDLKTSEERILDVVQEREQNSGDRHQIEQFPLVDVFGAENEIEQDQVVAESGLEAESQGLTVKEGIQDAHQG